MQARFSAVVKAARSVDPPHGGGADRLSPVAVRETLRRRAVLALLAGLVAAAATVGLVVVDGRGLGEAAFAGLVALVAVAAAVVSFGSLGLVRAANRRLAAVTSGDRARARRIRKAVLRRRVDALAPEDREVADTWARVAEPAFWLQLVTVGTIYVLVVGSQVVPLASAPRNELQWWAVAWILATYAALLVVLARQWRTVATAVRDREASSQDLDSRVA